MSELQQISQVSVPHIMVISQGQIESNHLSHNFGERVNWSETWKSYKSL